MKRALILILAALVWAGPSWAAGASDILNRVKAAEAGFRDFRADMFITEGNKKNVSGMGEGYGDILRLQKAIVQYKKPDKIRYDGFAQDIQLAYVQNGYVKLVFGAMIRHKDNVKDAPGKRQDTLDLGFLSSRLWVDNDVSVVSNSGSGVVKLKFDPKFGGEDKRHDFVWVNSKTLRVLKREKYRGSGELRISITYGDFQALGGKLPIATTSTMYDSAGRDLGSVKYKNLKSNVGLSDALFSLDQR